MYPENVLIELKNYYKELLNEVCSINWPHQTQWIHGSSGD